MVKKKGGKAVMEIPEKLLGKLYNRSYKISYCTKVFYVYLYRISILVMIYICDTIFVNFNDVIA